MILYGCPATGTVSLSIPSLVRLPYSSVNQPATMAISRSNKDNGSNHSAHERCTILFPSVVFMYVVISKKRSLSIHLPGARVTLLLIAPKSMIRMTVPRKSNDSNGRSEPNSSYRYKRR